MLKRGFSFSALDRGEVANIWDSVWQKSDCFEVMALALAWFDHKKQADILVDQWPRLKKWSARIDNWAHSDTLSGIYARILEQSPASTYPTLQKWNQSKSPWLRRLSIVSLMYYSSQRKKVLPLPKILALVEPQIEFDHYYVQKGVGWTLREAGNVYPKETYKFLEKNIQRLSAPAFSAATEKLTKQQKDRLKVLRKGR
jgi:3-methyladenine DNA glycosylase AlkD